MINAKDKRGSYRSVPDGAYYYGLTLITGEIYRLLMWSDLLGVEGNDREVRMTFRLYDVTIKGSGLVQLIRDAKRHKIDILTVAPRSQAMMGGEGLVATHIDVKAGPVMNGPIPVCGRREDGLPTPLIWLTLGL